MIFTLNPGIFISVATIGDETEVSSRVWSKKIYSWCEGPVSLNYYYCYHYYYKILNNCNVWKSFRINFTQIQYLLTFYIWFFIPFYFFPKPSYNKLHSSCPFPLKAFCLYLLRTGYSFTLSQYSDQIRDIELWHNI